jgi:hypothetical protein
MYFGMPVPRLVFVTMPTELPTVSWNLQSCHVTVLHHQILPKSLLYLGLLCLVRH